MLCSRQSKTPLHTTLNDYGYQRKNTRKFVPNNQLKMQNLWYYSQARLASADSDNAYFSTVGMCTCVWTFGHFNLQVITWILCLTFEFTKLPEILCEIWIEKVYSIYPWNIDVCLGVAFSLLVSTCIYTCDMSLPWIPVIPRMPFSPCLPFGPTRPFWPAIAYNLF